MAYWTALSDIFDNLIDNNIKVSFLDDDNFTDGNVNIDSKANLNFNKNIISKNNDNLRKNNSMTNIEKLF